MINNIDSELVIGLAGGLGVNFPKVMNFLTNGLEAAGYHCEIIQVSKQFPKYRSQSKFAREYWKMQYGTKMRLVHGNDYWGRQTIKQIYDLRPKLAKKHKKIAYIVRSLKNKEELNILANVYGSSFIAIGLFSEEATVEKRIKADLRSLLFSVKHAQKQIDKVNLDLGLKTESITTKNLIKFLIKKDQLETHLDLKECGQNLSKCYSSANFFVYIDKNLERQFNRFYKLLFNYPFAEPSFEEYFMFCAQAAAYRSLDVDRQVGAVIINNENELVASGFNDVSKVGGGHFANHDHPLYPKVESDSRDFRLGCDYGHLELDKIARNIARKLSLEKDSFEKLRDELSEITEFKRSTHAEMSALLDAARRGVTVRNCTMYVNTYPCHNCTKHIIAAGIKKIVFLHPYAKSKAREMFGTMLLQGVLLDTSFYSDYLVFEPFVGVSPNRFMTTFNNDKETRLETINGKETGNIVSWEINQNSVPRRLTSRRPYVYIAREWAVINNQLPDISSFYKD